ncbi:hypothetical protein P9J82_09405 [Glaesserella parasuis]|uniref:Uncharacterized protein n=3 Tax=Glaesserella parasuis TaxID=738 RepID=A0A145QNN0_GLAPU|nr:hypothetical protein [Glaesserella parasuis]AGO15517.1 hypothetical protein K756_01215 [Glaesserella parasuis ZJ0906]EQA02730.1 hypothetical protein HPSSW114_0708 [Glaesserella parasuis SW114]EQA05779.1 hypothetical protein HPS12939_0824 [Glaesserella parasuis 12939]EQA10620.1 hypothetical protein HPSH465_0789 [Glaesserella parasuis H465]EQA13335.1 hypothetical protein HPSSW140_0902 [Glaesserella parasuis SW140]
MIDILPQLAGEVVEQSETDGGLFVSPHPPCKQGDFPHKWGKNIKNNALLNRALFLNFKGIIWHYVTL